MDEHRKRACVAALIVAALLLGCAPQPDDTTISWGVVNALSREPHLSPSGIRVETVHGYVTLHGRVASERHARRVVELARSTPGVVAVRNQLTIETTLPLMIAV